MPEVEIYKDEVFLKCYHHLLEPNDFDIELVWGGRDSGKSQVVAQIMVKRSMEADYFRGILIKLTHESIKDAQWQMMKDVAEDWGVDHLFEFKTSPLSITNQSGANFLTRGMDKPGKIRSITNPSDAWVEEGNQISEESFITLITGLRSRYGRVKLWITFNPESIEPNFEDFWLYKMFFAGRYPDELNFTGEIRTKVVVNGKEEEVVLKYRSTHTTYHDNPYVPAQRVAFHEMLQHDNPYWYNVFTLGMWGNPVNDSPFVYTYDRQKHVPLSPPQVNRALPLYLSWDFNRNPMCCGVIQWAGGFRDPVNVIKAYKHANMGVDGICDRILADFPGMVYVVTGDYSGKTDVTLFQDNTNNYTIIQRKLMLARPQIKIAPNPRLFKNRMLLNLIFSHMQVNIHKTEAKPLIFDLENVRAYADGQIQKGDRENPAQQADSLDWLRYFANMFLRIPIQQFVGFAIEL